MPLFHHDDNRHRDVVSLNGIFEIDSHLLAAIGDNLVLFSLFLLEELNAELPYKAAYKKHDIVNLLTKIYSYIVDSCNYLLLVGCTKVGGCCCCVVTGVVLQDTSAFTA